jgi:hypothetical protein
MPMGRAFVVGAGRGDADAVQRLQMMAAASLTCE